MLKLATFVLAFGLVLATGCAAHDNRVALNDRCNSGDQNACQQIAADEAPAPYPPNQTIHALPGGSPGPNVPNVPGGGVHVGGIGGLGGIGGGGIGGIH
jgi:hypothetical protein